MTAGSDSPAQVLLPPGRSHSCHHPGLAQSLLFLTRHTHSEPNSLYNQTWLHSAPQLPGPVIFWVPGVSRAGLGSLQMLPECPPGHRATDEQCVAVNLEMSQGLHDSRPALPLASLLLCLLLTWSSHPDACSREAWWLRAGLCGLSAHPGPITYQVTSLNLCFLSHTVGDHPLGATGQHRATLPIRSQML